MELQSILISALILGGVGLTFGLLIALANRRFRVIEDPRLRAALERLPGTNCGACGYPGCQGFADGLLAGDIQPASCTNLSGDEILDLAGFLGVEAGEANRTVARLLCAGGDDVAPRLADYRGLQTCAAATAVAGGGKACSWGCLGLADCELACTFHAIGMSPTALPVVDPALCTACGDCVEACPKDLFTLMPVEQKLIVQCRSLLEGETAEAACRVACTGCERCAADAREGLIEIVDGLARIDYQKNELAGEEALARCPTGAIVWVENAQFERTAVADLARSMK